MVDKKSAFKIYGSYAEQVNALTDSEAGRLFKALVNYKNGEEPKNLSGMEQIAFLFIRQQMDYDCEKYERRCEQNRKNGMKGGRPRKGTKKIEGVLETANAEKNVPADCGAATAQASTGGGTDTPKAVNMPEKSYLLTLQEVG